MYQGAALAVAVQWLMEQPGEREIKSARIIVCELLPQRIRDFGCEHGYDSVRYREARNAHMDLVREIDSTPYTEYEVVQAAERLYKAMTFREDED